MGAYLNRICRNVLRTDTTVPATSASFGDQKIERNIGNNDIVKLNTSPSSPADSFKITAGNTCGFTFQVPGFGGSNPFVAFAGLGASPAKAQIDYIPLWTGVDPWKQMHYTAGAGFVSIVNNNPSGPVLSLTGLDGGTWSITSYGCSALLNRRSAGHWQISLIAFMGLTRGGPYYVLDAGTTYLQDTPSENPRGTYSSDGTSENISNLGQEMIYGWGAGKFTIADNP